MNWFKKKATVEVDTTFMDVIEMFFVQHMPLTDVKHIVSNFPGRQRGEADKALQVIVLSNDPSRDTVLLVQVMAKLDRALTENQNLRSRVVSAESKASDRLRFINTVEHAMGKLS